jgi:RNA-directed DNA polymerase
MRAVRKHVTCPWALLYIERWLTAPMLREDGTLIERARGTPQGGVVSPVLANLFLHYTFDLWMARTFPHLRWCRYADDGLVHCRTEKEARAVWIALNSRMAECCLELHPTKTKIVYCRDGRRKGKFENVAFDFLGYGFRPRSVKGPASQRMLCGYTPAVSKPALNAMRSKIRSMTLRKRTEVTLDDIARELNPITRGWIAYYGRYTRSALYPLVRYIDQTLAVWIKRKYKRFHRRLGQAREFLTKIARESPRLFVHWQLGASGGLT